MTNSVPVFLRRSGWLLALACALVAAIALWRWDPHAAPVVELPHGAHGRHDHGDNALWMRRHWIHEGEVPPDVERLAQELEALGIRRIYPFLGPMDPEGWPGWRDAGRIRRYEPARAQRFFSSLHEADPQIQILPWTGGNLHQDVVLEDEHLQRAFANHAARLVALGADGVHMNVEPLPDGTLGYLGLLRIVRAALPPNATLSVAAYPPLTPEHDYPSVHWSLAYTREVCEIADELAVMSYDTALRSPGAYQRLVAEWTQDLLRELPLRAEGGCDVLMGVPSYEDDEPYHDPDVETVANALEGILFGLEETPGLRPLTGVALYASWTTDAEEWAAFERRWRGRAPSGAVVHDASGP